MVARAEDTGAGAARGRRGPPCEPGYGDLGSVPPADSTRPDAASALPPQGRAGPAARNGSELNVRAAERRPPATRRCPATCRPRSRGPSRRPRGRARARGQSPALSPPLCAMRSWRLPGGSVRRVVGPDGSEGATGVRQLGPRAPEASVSQGDRPRPQICAL